jgi:hypothetical protein
MEPGDAKRVGQRIGKGRALSAKVCCCRAVRGMTAGQAARDLAFRTRLSYTHQDD